MRATHPLADWLDGRMSRAEFARQVGISESHLSLVLQGKRGLSLDTALKIERLTARDVSVASLAVPAEAAE